MAPVLRGLAPRYTSLDVLLRRAGSAAQRPPSWARLSKNATNRPAMSVLEELERQSEDRFLAIYEGLAQNGFGPLDGEVAKALRFRPQAIRKLPMAKRARQARSIIQRTANTELCYEVFGTYLVTKQKDLVIDFLDSTGVEHEEGIIQNNESLPDEAKVEEAVQQLDDKFDKDDVTLYLALAAEQWNESEKIRALWSARGA